MATGANSSDTGKIMRIYCFLTLLLPAAQTKWVLFKAKFAQLHTICYRLLGYLFYMCQRKKRTISLPLANLPPFVLANVY